MVDFSLYKLASPLHSFPPLPSLPNFFKDWSIISAPAPPHAFVNPLKFRVLHYHSNKIVNAKVLQQEMMILWAFSRFVHTKNFCDI